MADNHTRDELAQLRAELTADFVARLAAQAATLRAERRCQFRLPHRILPLALVALLVLLTPLSLLAASPFNDLTGGVHDANIGLIYDAGITKGCVPNVSYCPTANVTREEMASFLARTAGLGANPPVANAKTAQTATNAQNAVTAQTATTATSAGNANTVGGYAPSGLTRAALGEGGLAGDFTNQPNIPSGSVGLDIATARIVAPGPGFVVVVASGAAFTDTNTDCPCSVSSRLIDRSASNPAAPSQYMSNTLPNHPSGLFGNAALSNTYVFPVAVAGLRTYSFTVTVIRPMGAAHIGAAGTIVATFVPFGYDGGTTLAP